MKKKLQRKFQRNAVGVYRDGPKVYLERGTDGNERSREGVNGRIYVSKSEKTVWLIRVNGELEDGMFSTWKEAESEAKRRYPNSDVFLAE